MTDVLNVTTQLRDYHVRDGAWDQFLDAWQRQVPPLRAAHGFDVEAWAAPSEGRIVWFLSYPGSTDDFEAADRAYYDSDERRAFDPEPSQVLESREHFFVERVSRPR